VPLAGRAAPRQGRGRRCCGLKGAKDGDAVPVAGRAAPRRGRGRRCCGLKGAKDGDAVPVADRAAPRRGRGRRCCGLKGAKAGDAVPHAGRVAPRRNRGRRCCGVKGAKAGDAVPLEDRAAPRRRRGRRCCGLKGAEVGDAVASGGAAETLIQPWRAATPGGWHSVTHRTWWLLGRGRGGRPRKEHKRDATRRASGGRERAPAKQSQAHKAWQAVPDRHQLLGTLPVGTCRVCVQDRSCAKSVGSSRACGGQILSASRQVQLDT
jgi:hypothetical protein